MLVVYNNHQVESLSRFSARFCWLLSEGDTVDPLLNVTELNKKKNFLSFLILYKRLLQAVVCIRKNERVNVRSFLLFSYVC